LILARLQCRLPGTSEPASRLRILVGNHVDYFLTHPHEMKVLSHEDDVLKDELAADIASLKRQYYRCCADLVDGLKASKGLQFNGSYTFSKSIDYNSRNVQGLTVQDSYNLRNDRGLSDFDARHRFVLNGIYQLPFKGNRLVQGWEVSLIETIQSGNPINFHLSNTSFAGAAVLRPNVSGNVITGFSPATNGSATAVSYIQNPGVFINQGTTPGTTLGFGNLGRNAIIGPGFSNLDFSILKRTAITERVGFEISASAFDLLNQANFNQPGSTVGPSTLGLITAGTRFPAGDTGSSRQLQLSLKLYF